MSEEKKFDHSRSENMNEDSRHDKDMRHAGDGHHGRKKTDEEIEHARHRKRFKDGHVPDASQDTILSVRDLWVEYTSGTQLIQAVNGVSFDIKKGESLGLVGESGCGKSTIAKALLKILPERSSRIRGEMWYKDCEMCAASEEEMLSIRGSEISMIFQDPMTALNPVKRVIDQVSAVVRLHNPGMPKRKAEEISKNMLLEVGIGEDRVRDYPHQFSGGMQQRVEVAIGLSCRPDLLLADEPTTALDVTIQAQVLDMMRNLMHEKNTALLLITHNLGIVAEMCDYVAVLYGGEIIEYGSRREIFKDPCHPYTIGLFGAIPDMHSQGDRLQPIEGVMPEPSDLPDGCKFHTRCPYVQEECKSGKVPVSDLGGTHRCQCHRIDAVRAARKEAEA